MRYRAPRSYTLISAFVLLLLGLGARHALAAPPLQPAPTCQQLRQRRRYVHRPGRVEFRLPRNCLQYAAARWTGDQGSAHLQLGAGGGDEPAAAHSGKA
nr:hypothetical protein Hi04_10k_c1889_00025 [uncultured bacterium]